MSLFPRIFVTGANGFVGCALADYLDRSGFEVMRAVRRKGNVSGHSKSRVVGDITGSTSWMAALKGVDSVVHCAARVHVMREAAEDPYSAFKEVNVAGTLNLARQACVAGVKRFVYLSSVKVNGEESVQRPFSETDSPCPLDDYGRSKFAAEQGLFAIAKEQGLEVVVVRPPLVYGPLVKANFRKIMEWVAKGIPLPLGSIENRRSLLGVENLVDMLGVCLIHPAAAGQVFMVSDGEDLSTTELVYRIGRALGRPARLLPVPQRLLENMLKAVGKGGMAQRLCGTLQVDIWKAKTVLDWYPPFTVEQCLLRTAKWYQGETS